MEVVAPVEPPHPAILRSKEDRVLGKVAHLATDDRLGCAPPARQGAVQLDPAEPRKLIPAHDDLAITLTRACVGRWMQAPTIGPGALRWTRERGPVAELRVNRRVVAFVEAQYEVATAIGEDGQGYPRRVLGVVRRVERTQTGDVAHALDDRRLGAGRTSPVGVVLMGREHPLLWAGAHLAEDEASVVAPAAERAIRKAGAAPVHEAPDLGSVAQVGAGHRVGHDPSPAADIARDEPHAAAPGVDAREGRALVGRERPVWGGWGDG
jgi:hypothetical protein